MACGDKTWSSAPFLRPRDNLVWWHVETKHGQAHPFCYPETMKYDGTRRQSIIIRSLFSIQRQSSLMAGRDKTWSFAFLQSRDNQARWHAKTKHGHRHLFRYPETIKSDATRRQCMVIRTFFAIQRQSSLMVRADKTWSFTPFMVSRDNQVKWHAETKHGHLHPFCYQETIKSNGMWRQTWSSTPILVSRANQVRWHVVIKHGRLHPFCNLETIKSDGT